MSNDAAAGRIHTAIIMDGNGRWAVRRGLPRVEGHSAGARVISKVARAAPQAGISTLTLFAFSANNWSRPESEVLALMQIFGGFFRSEICAWRREGVHVSVIGRRDRIPLALRDAIEDAERETCGGEQLHLRLAIDYSGREVILEAARRFPDDQTRSPAEFARLVAQACHACPEDPDVDLVIRTGGEQRLSDFLLWELAYAELWFTGKLWPDFNEEDLAAALESFRTRERRYGGSAPLKNCEGAVLAGQANSGKP